MHSLKLIVKCCLGIISGYIIGVLLGKIVVTLPFIPRTPSGQELSIGTYTGTLCAVLCAWLVYRDHFCKLTENEPNPADLAKKRGHTVNTETRDKE